MNKGDMILAYKILYGSLESVQYAIKNPSRWLTPLDYEGTS